MDTMWKNETNGDLIVKAPDGDRIIPPGQERPIPSEHDAYIASLGLVGLVKQGAPASTPIKSKRWTDPESAA